jgi:hypothetical protein
MSDIIRVRDHSRPCEHGSLWPHWAEVRKAKWWQEPDCLGGREMVLRRLGEGVWEEVDEESRLQA